MTDKDRNGTSEFNAEVIAEFRENEGCVSGVLADTPREDRHGTQAGTTTSERIPGSKSRAGTNRFTALASEIGGAALADLWPKLIEAAPAIAEFQAQTTRQIPIFVLSCED